MASNLPPSYYGKIGGKGKEQGYSAGRSGGIGMGGTTPDSPIGSGMPKNKPSPDMTGARVASPIGPEGRRTEKTQPAFKGVGRGAPPDRTPKTEAGRPKNKSQPGPRGVGRGKGMSAGGGRGGKKNVGGGSGGSAPLTRGKSGGNKGSDKMEAAGSAYTNPKAMRSSGFRVSTYHV